MSSILEKINSIREEAIEKIAKVVKTFRGQEINLVECDYNDCPIVQDSDDDEYIFTLDSVRLEDDGLHFSGSSCWDSNYWNEDTISTDALVGISEEIDDIADWCRDFEDEDCDANI